MYTVIRRSQTSRNTDGLGEIMDTGGQHDDLHSAVVECAARNAMDAAPGSSLVWTVESDAPEDADAVASETCEADEVYDYLVNVLGVAEDEAARLVG